jgi:hypothetical protein
MTDIGSGMAAILDEPAGVTIHATSTWRYQRKSLSASLRLPRLTEASLLVYDSVDRH